MRAVLIATILGGFALVSTGCGKGSSAELACNNEDDDNDGAIDEGFGVGALCEGVGECGAGLVECATATSVRCSVDPGGSADASEPERCDDFDHDCDGEPMNGIGVGTGCDGEGICGAGVIQCLSDGEAVCSTDPRGSNDQSVPETCDGRDEDCDGAIDEDWMVGEACDGGGACGMGIFECVGDADSICSTGPGGSMDLSTVEVCNTIDDDCDGFIDEDFETGLACDGIGECGAGFVECADESTTRCSTDPGGSMDQGMGEQCDGIDNDCDDTIDEGFDIGTACMGVGGCGGGLIECNSLTTTQCSSDPGGSDFIPRAEVCDGIDNDCNGMTDDGDPEALCRDTPVGGSCTSGACFCPPGTFDIDRDTAPGCECTAAPAVTDGVTCNTAIVLGSISDAGGGNQVMVTGNVLPSDRDVWYHVLAIDTADTSCDNFHFRARFTQNPNDSFELTVFKGSCTTPLHADAGCTDEVDAFDMRATISGRLTGQCPCTTTVGASRPTNVSSCVNDTEDYFVRVRRREGSTLRCESYELEISNGVYNW